MTSDLGLPDGWHPGMPIPGVPVPPTDPHTLSDIYSDRITVRRRKESTR